MRFLVAILIIINMFAINAFGQRRTEPIRGFDYDYDEWPYPLNEEVGTRFGDLAKKYPNLAKLHVIGESQKGRVLFVLEITNFDTGPGESKPGLWFDGNIHAGEISGRQYLAYFAKRALMSYGKDDKTTRILDTHTFYVMPVFDADKGDRSLSRHPNYPGYDPEEQNGADLNGDGWISRMRWKERGSDEYTVITEGTVPGEERGEGRFEGRVRDPITGFREEGDFNRNWSGEWSPAEPGAGLFPGSIPEIYAVMKFITDRPNIYFTYSIHSGSGSRSYIVRPPMDQPYEYMHAEDNDWYTRVGAVWSSLSGGGIMENNMYSYLFNTSRIVDDTPPKEPTRHPYTREIISTKLEGEPEVLGYSETYDGFADDWAFMTQGMHSLTPEINGSAPDYNGDGWVRRDEHERYHQEELGGKYTLPWEPYNHPDLGQVEIGGSIGGWRSAPYGIGPLLKHHSEIQYDLLLYIADQSPLLQVEDINVQPEGGSKYQVSARIRNTGWLGTYVTQKALEIRRDYPVVALVEVAGGHVIDGSPLQGIGHIKGKHSYLRAWVQGDDQSFQDVEWTIKAEGSGSVDVTVKAWGVKAGRDEKTITIERGND